MVVINATSLLGRAVAGWRGLGSELAIAFLWLLIVLSAVFIVGIVLAVIRSSLVDARDVSGKEARSSIETVSALLASGQVDERTLVDVGRGWQSISDCFEFEDALVAHRSRRSRQRLIIAVSVLATVAGLGFALSKL